MNEPNSVVAGKLQLVLLAGKRRQQINGQWIDQNVLDPSNINHVASSSAVVYPGGGASPYSLVNFAVPAGSCLVVDYLSCYTTLNDKSTLQVNYGLNANFSCKWQQITGGESQNITPFVESQALLNSPCFLVFNGGSTARFILSTGVIVGADTLVLLRMNGYLLDSAMYATMKQHQTVFFNG